MKYGSPLSAREEKIVNGGIHKISLFIFIYIISKINICFSILTVNFILFHLILFLFFFFSFFSLVHKGALVVGYI